MWFIADKQFHKWRTRLVYVLVNIYVVGDRVWVTKCWDEKCCQLLKPEYTSDEELCRFPPWGANDRAGKFSSRKRLHMHHIPYIISHTHRATKESSSRERFFRKLEVEICFQLKIGLCDVLMSDWLNVYFYNVIWWCLMKVYVSVVFFRPTVFVHIIPS